MEANTMKKLKRFCLGETLIVKVRGDLRSNIAVPANSLLNLPSRRPLVHVTAWLQKHGTTLCACRCWNDANVSDARGHDFSPHLSGGAFRLCKSETRP